MSASVSESVSGIWEHKVLHLQVNLHLDRGSPSAVPVTKSALRGSPSAAPVTKSAL